MTEVIYPPLYPYFFEALKNTNERIILIAPYIKLQTVQLFLNELGGRELDVSVITCISSNNFLSRSSDIEALELLLHRFPGMRLVGIGNLHAKCYIFDGHTAILGSSNFTPSGLSHNLEVAMKINDTDIISSLEDAFMKKYAEQGSRVSLKDIQEYRRRIEAFLSDNKVALKQYREHLEVTNRKFSTFNSKSVFIEGDDADLAGANPKLLGSRIPSIKVINDSQSPFSLAASDQEWDLMYGQLVAYREKHPDRWPTCTYKQTESPLDIWCDRQREMWITQKLSPLQRQRLTEIAFIYSRMDAIWPQGIAHLKNYLSVHSGEWPLQGEVYPGNFRIGDWLAHLIDLERGGKLLSSRKSELQRLGFALDHSEWSWRSNVRLLKLQRNKKGHWPFPAQKIRGTNLYEWLLGVDANARSLSSKHKNSLLALGFPFGRFKQTVNDELWHYNFDKVIIFAEKNKRLPKKNGSIKGERYAHACLISTGLSSLKGLQKIKHDSVKERRVRYLYRLAGLSSHDIF